MFVCDIQQPHRADSDELRLTPPEVKEAGRRALGTAPRRQPVCRSRPPAPPPSHRQARSRLPPSRTDLRRASGPPERGRNGQQYPSDSGLQGRRSPSGRRGADEDSHAQPKQQQFAGKRSTALARDARCEPRRELRSSGCRITPKRTLHVEKASRGVAGAEMKGVVERIGPLVPAFATVGASICVSSLLLSTGPQALGPPLVVPPLTREVGRIAASLLLPAQRLSPGRG